MALENFQYKLENFSLYFHGGVRRSIIIFSVVVLVLLAPIYFLGKFTAGLYAKSYLELNNFAVKSSTDVYDYEIGKTQIANLNNGESILYTSVRNKRNRDVGFYPWNYSIQILDKSGTVLTPKENFTSYLLPDDNRYIVTKAPQGGVEMKIIEEPGTQKVIYNANANPLLTQPNIAVLTPRITVNKASSTMTVNAVLRNEDKRFVSQVNLVYFVRDTQDSILFAGSSSFNGFAAGTDRDFTVANLPLPAKGDPKTLNVLWSVNYLNNSALSLQ